MIGTERKHQGIKQVKLSGPVTHIRRQILSSLTHAPGQEGLIQAINISAPFTTRILTLLITAGHCAIGI